MLAQYLRDFLADLSQADGAPQTRGGPFWWRKSQGWVQLSADEYREYRVLLHKADQAFAPDRDLSESALDSALQAAIFDAADLPGTRASNGERRISEAIDAFRSFVERPAQEYECWLEVEGLRADSLPAHFGDTRFVLLGDRDIEHLANLVQTKHTADETGKLDSIERMAEELRGRPVAVHRVVARDDNAAVSLATRNLSIAIECLNFFAGLIPYNSHRVGTDERRRATSLRIGEAKAAIALRMAVAADGSFSHSLQATKLGTFSFERLRELTGPAGDALKRVESLLLKKDRTPVDELLLRAARWIGRATDADSLEDEFLFSMIALECAMLPTQIRDKGKHLSARIANLLTEDVGARRTLRGEMARLYGVRSRLVHDGSREIPDTTCDWLYEVARETIVRALVSPEIERVRALDELDALLRTK